MAILQAEKLVKNFKNGEVNVEVIKGIDLQIKEGEFVSIMGPSGSGKSTLLYLLSGLEQPTEGRVKFDGENISGLDENKLSIIRRRELGFVFQFYNLVPVLDVCENILMPITLDNKNEKDYNDQLNELLKIVGLEDRKNYRPSQLSGGQQQRVAIARALINNPKVIFADEPTGNLDSESSKDILILLKKLCKEKKKTIVMVTHDTKTAEYADRIINIKDGMVFNDVHMDK